VPTEAELVTPERVLYSGEAEFVVLRTDGGEIMFLPEHAPFVGAVDISLLRIAPAGSTGDDGGAEFRAAVHGGFVHVAGNRVTVLASVAEPAGEIDVERARRALEAARAALGGERADRDREREAAAAGAGTEEVRHAPEQSAAMTAMLFPDDPEVARRRAEVRLEAAGAELPAGGGTAAAS
jgi:F-type H+-transporting ATPase subunit epsilon